jgi:Tfp pilus assembly protein PilN
MMNQQLNLIPYGLKEKKQRIFQIRQNIGYCILLALAIFSGTYFPSVKLAQLRVEEQRLLARVNENKAAIEESKLIANEIAGYNERVKLIEYISKNKVQATTKIADIQKYIHTDIRLVSLNYTAEGIAIVGNTGNYNAISEFVANLQTSKKFKTVKINSINKDGDGILYSFTIDIKY